MFVKLEFAFPELVSLNYQENPDKVSISFNNVSIVQSTDNQYLDPESNTLKKFDLPRMMSGSIIDLAVLFKVLQYILLISLVTSHPLAKHFGSQIIGAIGQLNVLSHLVLLNLKYPLNLELFFSTIFPFITYDMIDTTWLYGKMFGINADSAFSTAWTTFGYGAHLVINNIGSVMLFIWLQPVLLLFTYAARKYLKSKRCKGKVQTKIDEIFGSWV